MLPSFLLSIAKGLGGPGSIRLLIGCVAAGVGVGFLWPRRRKAVRLGLAILAALYLVMAMPGVARIAASRLPQVPTPSGPELRNIQTLFILDGDNRFGRIREFERIYAIARPAQIYLLGRLSVYKDLLLVDIPRAGLHHDNTSFTTADQIERVSQLIKDGASASPAMLVSKLQAPRVARFAKARGLAMPIISAPLDADLPEAGLRAWLPSLSALAITRDAIYELAALWNYT